MEIFFGMTPNVVSIFNPLTPESQKNCTAHKFQWNRDQFYFRLIFLDVFGSALHDVTISESEEYLLRPRELVKLEYGLQRSVSLSRQGLAALYCWDGDLAFYTSRMEVFFTC